MVSSPLDLKQQQVNVECPTHGAQIATVFKLFSNDWTPAVCGVCEHEKRQEEEQRETERKDRDRKDRDQRLLKSRLASAAIPPRFEARTFANYTPGSPESQKALAICQQYASGFHDHRKAGTSLILCGNAGTGKTHLACAVAQHVIHQGMSAVYMTVGRAFRKVKDTYRKTSEQTEDQALRDFALPDLLVLDEIGVQYGSDTEKNILFEIVNERYEAMKPTILISNLALPALAEYAGERVIDRMKENGGKLVAFDWKSHRGAA